MSIGWVDIGAVAMIIAIVWWFWGSGKSKKSDQGHH